MFVFILSKCNWLPDNICIIPDMPEPEQRTEAILLKKGGPYHKEFQKRTLRLDCLFWMFVVKNMLR